MRICDLNDAIQKVCPIIGITVKTLTDKDTVVIHYMDEATNEEILAAEQVLENAIFPLTLF
jgi:hypothetical protein